MRPSNRQYDELRAINFTRNYIKHAEGSVLVEFGQTKVICNVSVIDGVPRFLKGTHQGWITAEYSMLPRATHSRNEREANKGRQSGRTLEIQRLIGRALRACFSLKLLGEVTLAVDCDVIQADGGTRTAAITGSCLALYDALQWMVKHNKLRSLASFQKIAAVSVGIYRNRAVLDLDYAEDVIAETDMNIVMSESGKFIEVQGTAESGDFDRDQLNTLLTLAENGITQLIQYQKSALQNMT